MTQKIICDFLGRNPSTEMGRISTTRMEKGSCHLCRKCGNFWRKECIVTQPALVVTMMGVERCSHYFKDKQTLTPRYIPKGRS